MPQKKWIWQQDDWPRFRWCDDIVQPLLHRFRVEQGRLLGQFDAVGAEHGPRITLDILLQSIVASSAIEGERLDEQSVRSSLARRLGLDMQNPYPVSAQSEGLAEIALSSLDNLNRPMTRKRLFEWHHLLFPAGGKTFAGEIRVGQLRGDVPMQVVSGRIDRPTVHFEAPPHSVLNAELDMFLQWFEESRQNTALDPLLRAAVCHFYFVTVHPFDDGNGRLARALTELALSQADGQGLRLYAMSAAILKDRKSYYAALEKCQRGNMDITVWAEWFLETLIAAVQDALSQIARTLDKTRFWQQYGQAGLSVTQAKVLNRLLDGGERGFEHGISASQYCKAAKVSKATATRHLADLLAKGCLEKLPGGGRSTRYQIRATKPATDANVRETGAD